MVAITHHDIPNVRSARRQAPRARRSPAVQGSGEVLRLVVSAALLVFVGAFVALVLVAVPGDGVAPAGATQTHVVQHGESMWSIANDVAPAGEAALYVERLVEVNGSSTVVPGQSIVVPAP